MLVRFRRTRRSDDSRLYAIPMRRGDTLAESGVMAGDSGAVLVQLVNDCPDDGSDKVFDLVACHDIAHVVGALTQRI